jgi:hypothetical protein
VKQWRGRRTFDKTFTPQEVELMRGVAHECPGLAWLPRECCGFRPSGSWAAEDRGG